MAVAQRRAVIAESPVVAKRRTDDRWEWNDFMRLLPVLVACKLDRRRVNSWDELLRRRPVRVTQWMGLSPVQFVYLKQWMRTANAVVPSHWE